MYKQASRCQDLSLQLCIRLLPGSFFFFRCTTLEHLTFIHYNNNTPCGRMMVISQSLLGKVLGFRVLLPWKVFIVEKQRKASASKEDIKHPNSWKLSSLCWEVETCLGGGGSPLGRHSEISSLSYFLLFTVTERPSESLSPLPPLPTRDEGLHRRLGTSCIGSCHKTWDSPEGKGWGTEPHPQIVKYKQFGCMADSGRVSKFPL